MTPLGHRLEQLAVTDELTGLPNRRGFTETQKTDERTSKVVRDCSEIALQQAIRDADLVARYGGEEFVIVLPDADLLLARQIAERIRTTIVALAEPHAQAQRSNREHRRRRGGSHLGHQHRRADQSGRQGPLPGETDRPQPGRHGAQPHHLTRPRLVLEARLSRLTARCVE